MRKLTIIGLVCLVIFTTTVIGAIAQDDADEPVTDDTTTQIQDLINTAIDAAQRAEAAADAAAESQAVAETAIDQANDALGHANDLFGLFEAMSGAVGLVIPFIAIFAGLVGFRRLENANTELRQAREKFEKDMEERAREIDKLQSDLKETARQQREDSARASLALALLQLGERQYKAQDMQGALDTYDRALDLDDRNPITHYRMGYVYVHTDRFDEAEKHLSRSLELDPSFMPAVATRAYVYRRMGDNMDPGVERDMVYNRAEENFLRALKIFPKLIDEDGESWWGSLGGLYRRRGQVDQAIYAYEQCAAAVPRSSYAYSNLALLYGQKQEIEKMISTYGQVEKLAYGEIQADVDNYWAYADLIAARLAQGKVEETMEVLDTALNVAPVDSPYTISTLVDTLNRLRNTLGHEETEYIIPILDHIQAFQAKRYGTNAQQGSMPDADEVLESDTDDNDEVS